MVRVTHVMHLSEEEGRHPFGGVENHLTTLLPALQREGADVEVVAMLGKVGRLVDDRLDALERSGVAVVRVRKPGGRRLRWLLWKPPDWANQLRRVLRSRRDRIVHVHLDLVFTLSAAILAGCNRIVVGIHNDEPFFDTLRWRLWLRVVDRRVSRYIANSDRVRQHFTRAAGLDPAKIETIYYGLEPARPAGGRDELRQRFGIPRGAYVVGFVGRLAPQKNVELLLEAFERLADIQAVIVGGGRREASLRELARRKGLRNVHFLGGQPDGAALLAMIDVLCLPSRWEGLGLVLVEAMLQGVPVLGSRAGAIPEILEEGRYGLLFDSGDAEGLAAAIRRCRDEPSDTRDRAAQARVRARRIFAVDAMTRATLAVYEKVLAE